MARKLVVSIRNITEDQKKKILEKAESLGWTAEIYDDIDPAAEAAKDAEVVFGDRPRLVYDAPQVKWICIPSAGINHFTNSERFMESGIMLSNSSGAYGTAISEHVIMMILSVLRHMPDYQKKVASREWYRGYCLKSIRESRITILGTGDIGRSIAVRLRSFVPDRIIGMNTSGRDDSGLFDEMIDISGLDTVLPETDILIMALPLTGSTKHIMDRERLKLLPDKALVVNVGRGACIDQTALLEELKADRLRAALDVFEKEPIPEDSEIWNWPNLLITPHVSGDMMLPYTVQKIVDMFLEDFELYNEGKKPSRLVDLRKGY